MADSEILEQFLNPSPLLRSTLDMLEPEIMFIDTNYRIIFLNRAKRERYPEIEFDTICYEVFEAYGERCPHCVAHHAMQTGSIQKNPDYTSIALDGEIRHINISVGPVIDENGETIGAVETVYDVEELYQTDLQLAKLNKEYESVIYALSHDLRSPLVSIEGFLRKLEKKHVNPEDPNAAHCIDRIRVNVRMMNDFVKVLLDTSRITRGELDLQTVDLNELIGDVLAQFEERAEKQGAQLTTAGDFPTVDCDRVRILQAFSNLVGNALAHCEDKEDLKIEIGCNKDGVFWVRDNGPGILEEMQKKVFEPFSQGAAKDSHFGMGMNIVYKIIQKHGGDTWIDSKPGGGTCVFFTFKPKRKERPYRS